MVGWTVQALPPVGMEPMREEGNLRPREDQSVGLVPAARQVVPSWEPPLRVQQVPVLPQGQQQ